MPLNTERYTNIVQSDITLNLANKGYNPAEKPNYKELIKNTFSTAYTYSEDNSVPIYDLNFTFLESINLSNNINCLNFLESYNLLDFNFKNSLDETQYLSSLILLDSETGELNPTNADSILIKPLLETLIKFPQIFGDEKVKLIMQDLISKIDLYSSIRFLSPIGQITKLNDDLISAFESNKILKKDFENENIFDITERLTKKLENSFSPEVLPQTAILNMDLRYPLLTEKTLDKRFYSAEILPSAYFNIAFMKNNRNPHYDINYTVYSNNNLYDYSINKMDYDNSTFMHIGEKLNNTLSGYIKNDNKYLEISGAFNLDIFDSSSINKGSNLNIFAQHKHDAENNKLNELYDIDITHSYEVNCIKSISGLFNDLNKTKTQNILNYAAIADLEISQNNFGYNYQFPGRMTSKIDDYLEPYKNYHISNNKLYNIGKLNGIRNYIKVGTLADSDKLWMSYKYNTVEDKTILEYNSKQFDIPTININLNRLSKHWLYDLYGNIIKIKVMKPKGYTCPWITTEDTQNRITGLTSIQKQLGCKCNRSEECNGFCTFPANNQLKIPSGNVSNIFTISGLTDDSCLFANSDIYVSDDLELYFVDNNKYEESLKEILIADKSLDTISGMFKSIINGFGGIKYDEKISANVLNCPEYLAINNFDNISGFTIAKNSPFNIAHTIPAGTKLEGLNWTTKEKTTVISPNQTAIIRIRSWWSNELICTGSIRSEIANPNFTNRYFGRCFKMCFKL